MANEQAETIEFLSRPDAYGLEGRVVERHETHGSVVFLCGERAYKLKRAVRYDYMDYSTAERRRAMCNAELAVNGRLAPEIYLDVCPVLRDRDRALRIGSSGEREGAIDWLVVMRRFPQDMLLEQMRRRGALTVPLMRMLAERVAAIHGATEIDCRFGGARGIAAVIEENIRVFEGMRGDPLEPKMIARWEQSAHAALLRLQPLLDARRDDGHVRRCHGDLHLNNICLMEGRPVLFDAIEFRDDFACIDVLYDLALLLMDLDRHGLDAEANALFNRYLERSGDYQGLAALPLFMSCRAAMRAHVAVTAARTDKIGAATERLAEAVQMLALANGYLAQPEPKLLAIGGVSGTGKSTLATGLAPLLGCAPGAIVLRTDVIRKELLGVDELVPLPEQAYSTDVTQKVYALLAERAGAVLRSGYSAIADAVFGTSGERGAIEAVACLSSAPFQGIWLDAPAADLERRVAARRNDASDATVAVVQTQLRTIRKPANWMMLFAQGSAADILARATDALKSKTESQLPAR
jgi:aminoglycoside phosphotransferase family enzyme/predicted kinase